MNIRKFAAAALAANIIVATASGSEDSDRALACQQDLRRSIEAEIIRDISVEDDGLRVVVDGKAWSAMDTDQQTILVKTVVCMITAGDKGKTARVNVVDPSHTVVGRFDGLNLVAP